jgi:hypothetical protein
MALGHVVFFKSVRADDVLERLTAVQYPGIQVGNSSMPSCLRGQSEVVDVGSSDQIAGIDGNVVRNKYSLFNFASLERGQFGGDHIGWII